MADEDERQRRLRQQRELVHGSGVPRSVVRAIMPGNPPRPERPRRWRDMGRAEKYALIQSQILLCGLMLAATYLLATKVGIVAGVAPLALFVAVFGYGVYCIVRER